MRGSVLKESFCTANSDTTVNLNYYFSGVRCAKLGPQSKRILRHICFQLRVLRERFNPWEFYQEWVSELLHRYLFLP
jgi:hypothetical protein